MTFDELKADIKSTVAATTPGVTTKGAQAFRHTDDETIRKAAVDRMFQVGVSSPPTRLGQCATTTPRWLTGLAVLIYYTPRESIVVALDTAAADAIAIQNALAARYATIHIVGEGDSLFRAAIEQDDGGHLILAIEFTCQHS